MHKCRPGFNENSNESCTVNDNNVIGNDSLGSPCYSNDDWMCDSSNRGPMR